MLYSQSGEKYSVNGNYLGVPDILGSKNYAPLNFATNSTIRALFTADGNFEVWYKSYFKKSVVVDSTITAWEIYAMYRLSVYGDVVVTGIMKSAKLILTDGNITSMTGTVVFGSNNLTTTGNVTAGSFNSPSFAGSSRAMLATDTAGNIIRKGYSGNPNDVLTGDGNWANLTQSTGWQWVDTNLVSTAPQVVIANNLAVGGKITVGQIKVISNGSNKDTLHTEKELVIITDSKNISLDADTVKIPRLLDSKRMETDTLNSKKINASKIYVAGDITSTGTVYTGNLYVANDVMLPLFAGTKNLLLTDSTGKVFPLGISSTSNKVLLSNGTWGAVPIPQNYWQMQNYDIYTLTPGNVGIGMNNPVYKLDIAGTVRISEDLLVGGGIIISEKVNATRELKSASLRADSIFMDNTKAFYGESRFADSVKIQSKLRVDGNIDVGGDLRSSGSLIFGSNKNITYFPHQNGITGDLCFGTQIPAFAHCYPPVIQSNQNWFGGSVNVWGNPDWDPSLPSSVLKLGSDGANGIIEIEGSNSQDGEAQLLINYYCGRNVVVGGDNVYGASTGNLITNHNAYLAVIDGKVGIGTINPDSKLEVAGEIHATGNVINGGPDFILGLNDGRANPSGRHRALVHDGWDFQLDELTINYDGDFLDGVHVMGVKTYFDGTVGIGVTPDANSPKLDVNGEVKIRTLNPPVNNFGVLVADDNGLVGKKNLSEICHWQISTNNNDIYNVNSGNVGIGTNSPAQDSKLHIKEMSGSPVFATIQNNNGSVKIGYNQYYGAIDCEGSSGVGGNLLLNYFSGNNVIIGGDVAGSGDLYTNHSAYLATLDGNVGIGTSYPTPMAMLHVTGKTVFAEEGASLSTEFLSPSGVQIYQNSAFAPQNKEVALIIGDTNHRSMWFAPYLGSWWYNPISKEGDVGIIFRNQNLNNGNSGFVIAPHSGVQFGHKGIRIDPSGQVGICTSIPAGYDDFKLFVKGKILCERVKVINNVPTADYVFDEDYNLIDLHELDSIIKKHRHLPDIPSAEEMKKNGIDLVELNILLLKKIEELTLYAIGQDKRIKELEEKSSK